MNREAILSRPAIFHGWLVVAAAILLAGIVRLRRGERVGAVATATLRLALWPAIAVLLFLADSRVTVGSWFVSKRLMNLCLRWPLPASFISMRRSTRTARMRSRGSSLPSPFLSNCAINACLRA